MQIFSALDAVSPAVGRTRLMLFTPFRIGRSWKLAITAYLAVAGTFFMPTTLLVFLFLPQLRELGGAIAVVLGIVVSLAVTLLLAYLVYLFTRLDFSYFDMVLNRGEFVTPAWRKYGPQSLKWMAVKVLFGTLLTAIVAVPMAAFLGRLFTLLSSIKPGEQTPPDLIFGMMSGFYGAYFLLLLFFWIFSVVNDFIVPSLALEDTTLGEAFRRVVQLVRTEPGQVTAYAFVKAGLGIAGYMGGIFVTEIAFFIVLLVVGIVAGLIGFLLHLIGVPTFVLIGLGVLLLLVLYAALLYALFFVIGTVMTCLKAYSLYFLGGRYPMLGDLLAASALPPVTALPLYSEPYPPPTYPA